jgi:hypothetical protein
MHERWLGIGAWVAFVFIVGTAAHLTLAACDLGLHPLFGLNYCQAEAADDPLAHERERERTLLDRLHEAQLGLSRLPVCLPETPRPEPDRRAENIEPTPTPTPTPTPSPTPTPTPTPTPDERLTIPQSLDDLKGCWQSVRGDIPMVSDDAEERPTGSVRICYCLGGNGRGTTRYIYQDGAKCIGPLRAQISRERLTMNHPRINCSSRDGRFVVPADIVCSNKPGDDSASCDQTSRGRLPRTTTDEKYRRVSPEYCK